MADLKWPATIPSNLKPGPYLIRFETLALHQANTPQFYPECVQLIVTGSGTAFPTADYLKPIPGAWTATDPGVLIDIYSTAAQTETTYQIPGPPIYPGFSGTSTGTTTTKSSTTTSKSSTTTTTTTTSKSTATTSSSKTTTTTTTTTSASGATQTHFGQCGGTGYTGPTVCASPYTCTYSNAYYSQCL
ncbi:carbohydrate-binding module family 1 protein [Tulasnella calospora MUT 4182]|uniref:AA9 family lytic polysaccharide monooxygenase n=1 Tax=Tulasnella calospora MUT 4182 TaxID=1051891 RepID=A0A0C3K490_9AGAM|nr:carbohydrate-binding module family 1 protein [Tulasnella calospora MUT 4182]